MADTTLPVVSKIGTAPISELQLNEGQQAARDQLIAYLQAKDKSKRAWLLQGYAGTGKTTTMGKVISDYLALEQGSMFAPSIAVSAPTHKAVSVLKKAQALGGSVQYATIHSLLGLKEVINPMTGKQEFKPMYGPDGPRIEGFDILILDEVSMLQRRDVNKKLKPYEEPEVDLYELIEEQMARGLKLIMMGDPVQIPPVNSPDAVPFDPVLREKHRIGLLELTQIMRQRGDNPILDYATDIRKVYKTGTATAVQKINPETGQGIETIAPTDNKRILEILKDRFTDPRFEHDPDFMKVIAWTNKTVDACNAEIRKIIYGGGPLPAIQRGEKLVCGSPVIERVMGRDTIILHTNQECTVLSTVIHSKDVVFAEPFGVRTDGSDGTTAIKYYETRIETEEFKDGQFIFAVYTVDIVHEDDLELFHKKQEGHKKVALSVKDPGMKSGLWKQYYANERKFAWMKYNYAVTGHKSQGSTYENVMVLEWDIDYNKKLEERNRIKYVAATRARGNLYIVK